MSRAATKKRKAPVVVLVVILITLVVVLGVFFYDYINGENRYPLLYEDSIIKYSDEFQLDPYMVAAVIHTESGFDPDAVSASGAVGLMQIMPETGEWIAGKIDMGTFDTQQLFDPDTNIRFGCWYLRFLSDRFDGVNQLIWAGYNAGHNRVNGWLEDPSVSEDGKTLTAIPYQETNDYVKKVENAYEKYEELYEIG